MEDRKRKIGRKGRKRLKKELTILQVNDTHSYLALHNELYYGADGIRMGKAGGYARIQSLVSGIRKERGEKVLFLDNGDTFHGTYEAVETKGASMVPVLNKLGLDAMTFHWDTAYGPAVLKELAAQLTYPVLAINVFKKDTKELFFKPYLMKEVNGIKVGIIGIASNMVDKTMPPSFSEGLYFTLGKEELPGWIEKVKAEGAELVVMLSHLGFPQDVQMLKDVRGIDVCISGHTHNRLRAPEVVEGAYIIQSGSQGSFLGRIDLTLEEGKITALSHELLDVREDVPEDGEMKALIDRTMDPYREKLDARVGETLVDLHRGTSLESPTDNLVLSALLKATDAEAAFSNGWRYGAPVPKGEVTLRDLYNIIPVNPPVSLVEMTGAEMYEMIEGNLESTYAKDPFSQMGGYLKRALGIRVYIKIENAKGSRIQKFFVGSEELDMERTYRVTFVTEQGVPKKFGKDRRNMDLKAVDALKDYLKDTPFELGHVDTYIVV